VNGLAVDIVIAGGGLAAVRTAEALREFGHRGRIMLPSDEAHLPYDRPPLSKSYLQGKMDDAQIRLLTQQELEELQIDARLSHRVDDPLCLTDPGCMNFGLIRDIV
jgi:3-phenylpropionate/trans-cinnamate dioxygenase ferredoxin reductase subunit